jgi:choline-sulfatase
MEMASQGRTVEPVDPLDGRSLVPLLSGIEDGADRTVLSEYSSEGVCAASRMLRQGCWKYIYTYRLPPLLFDLERDPDERVNLADRAETKAVQERLHHRLVQDWDPPRVHERILASQRRRLFLYGVSGSSELYSNWAYQPFVDERTRFIRGSGNAGPTAVKGRARFPYVEPVPPDRP